MGTILTILIGLTLSCLCFFVALNKNARYFLLEQHPIWRHGNAEQKRFGSSFIVAVPTLGGIGIIVFLVSGLLTK
jgi:hypothetical protein